jgi:hypothetical protein
MKRILLINPWIHDFSAYDLWLRPLGLLYIASFLEQRGYATDFLDCLDRFHPLLLQSGSSPRNRVYGTGKFPSEEIEKPNIIAGIPRRFKRFGISHHLVEGYLHSLKDVGIVLVTSSMTYWYRGVREIADLLRQFFPDARIVLGGIYATLLREHAEAESGADTVISGFNFFPVLGAPGREGDDFDPETFFNTVSPAYHLYDSLPHVAMITSIGCPFQCSYCASRRIAPDYVALSHDKILGDIEEYVERYEVGDIAFYDDALLWDAEAHFLPLFEEVARRRYPVRFHTPNGIHARFIDRKVAEVLRSSGFKTIRIGLESSHGVFQNETGMKVTNGEVRSAVDDLKRAGFSASDIGIYIMAGRPEESVEDVLETLAFVEQLRILAFVSEYSPVPGSKDWEREEGMVLEDPLWQNNTIAFLEHGWTMEDMQRIKDVKNRINRSVEKA